MKNLLLITLVVVAIVSCKKDDPDLVVDAHSIVGQTYSGYSFKSILDGSNMYRGYKFISASRAMELLLEENSRIISQTEVGYTYTYPNIKIEGLNTKDGFWYGVFDSSGALTISSVIMKKW